MAVYTHVSAEALARFLADYDVGTLVSVKGIAEGVENTNYLVDTTEARFILTLYEKRVAAGDLPFFMALLDHLAARGLPVPPALPGRDGVAVRTLEDRPACLIRFLPGVSLSHPTPAQAEAAAAMLARMHRAAAGFGQTRANSMGVATWRPLLDRCGAALDTIAAGLHADLHEAVETVTRDWPRPGTLARGIVHADLFPDNVLMTGDAVGGLIDFYFACTDIRVYDLAIMDTAWSFDGAGTRHDAAIGDALVAGYATGYPLSGAERAAFATLASGACVRFALSRAWDWLNTPADALVTRKDPLAYMRRLRHYAPTLAPRTAR